jgi:Chromo (CHRromatin Organisation MOdifier) domain
LANPEGLPCCIALTLSRKQENYIRPPPDIEEGEEVYEVEQILKHGKRGRGYEYLVKWVGYPITEALWEPKSNLTGATDILRKYQELHQL